MKRTILGIALAVCLAVPADAAELFGVEFGSPASNYDIGDNPVVAQGKMQIFKLVPPSPVEGFPGYALTAYDGRVVRLTAFSKADYSKDGASTKKTFAATVDTLKKKFGEPALYDDTLGSDSKYTAPDQWKKSLQERERILQSMWVVPDVKEGDELEAVWLEGNVIPQEPESASFLTISARVKDYPLYEKKAAQEAGGQVSGK